MANDISSREKAYGQLSKTGGRLRDLPTALAISTFLALTFGGCQMMQPRTDPDTAEGGPPPLPPALARMQKVYPELESGKFICLADFNSLPQATLCRMVGADGVETESQPEVSVRRSIDATGAGALRLNFEKAGEQLRFDGMRSETLALPRDWSSYTLLMFNVYGPPEGLALEFSVESGTDVPLRYVRRLFAEPGWHLYKYDLAELGDEIDLTDVRALAWLAPELSASAELYLDDVLLTENTRHVLGPDVAAGGLYLFTSGRRIIVGVRDSFELAFADGVITEWHAGGGPNLTVRNGMGPWPIPLPTDWHARQEKPIVYDDPHLFAAWGEQVRTRQDIIEASTARVVIEGHWRFLDTRTFKEQAAVQANETGGKDGVLSGHSWRYVVYPTGQVYITVTSIAGASGWPGERVGYALAMNGRVGFTKVTAEPRASGPASYFVLLSQAGRDRPDLLWCPADSRAAERQLELVSAEERRIAVMIGDLAPGDRLQTAHLLRLRPGDMDTNVEGQAFGSDYQNPATLAVTRGRLLNNQDGDLNQDGFNEAEGCYELELENGILRLSFSPGAIPRLYPRFRVEGSAGRECWIYHEGRIITTAGRDGAGRVLFVLPQAIGMPTTIEINSRSADGSRGESTND